MEPTKTKTEEKEEPAAVLRLPELDAELVRVLSKHWLVIVDADEHGAVIFLYDDYTT